MTDEQNFPQEENPASQPESNQLQQEETNAEATSAPKVNPEIAALAQRMQDVKREVGKLVVGQNEMLDQLLICLLCGGHALIEGVPGIAKTLTAKLLAQTLDVPFNRIQFTPDLMPADVVGTNVFNVKTSEFTFRSGPIFSNVVLIDEINRAPAKTQSALFEVMEEFQVTVDGETHTMDQPFLVLATQNPLEQEGTYKLPEAQLDRFLFRILISYPNLEEEIEIIQRFKEDFSQTKKEDVKAVITGNEILKLREAVEKITIDEGLVQYIARVIVETRNHPDLYLGASPRASLAILKAAKAHAALHARFFVTPDDVKRVAYAVLNHRIMLTPEREMEGYDSRQVIEEILNKIEVPR